MSGPKPRRKKCEGCDALSGLIWPLRPNADPAPFWAGEASLLALPQILLDAHLGEEGLSRKYSQINSD
jgi:hypothetical protein